MADLASGLSGVRVVSGLWVVGRLDATQVDGFTQFLISEEGPEGRRYANRVSYRRYSSQSGEKSEVAAAAEGVELGSLVMVRVIPRVRPGGVGPRGAYHPFVTFSARGGFVAL